ncbi:MAG: prepilin-type N-terminal cleavage/methylation domain-containing protein [Ramlibacter sp.]
MRMSLRVGNRAGRGFTLVEILVAMTLLSVVMLALGAAMRTIAQTETRVDERLARADEMRVASGFLFSILERVSVRKSDVTTKVGGSLYLFVGAPDAVMWIGVMPARYGAGGRYFFRLALESTGGGRGLVLRFVPWVGTAVFPDWTGAASRTLVSNASGLQIGYGDDTNANSGWTRQWSVADRLPGRIRISVSSATGAWPYLIIPMRALSASDNGRGGFSLGPE